jgi:hypothetical protein
MLFSMTKDKKAEEAEDRERMARILKRHEKPAPKKMVIRREDVNQAPDQKHA